MLPSCFQDRSSLRLYRSFRFQRTRLSDLSLIKDGVLYLSRVHISAATSRVRGNGLPPNVRTT